MQHVSLLELEELPIPPTEPQPQAKLSAPRLEIREPQLPLTPPTPQSLPPLPPPPLGISGDVEAQVLAEPGTASIAPPPSAAGEPQALAEPGIASIASPPSADPTTPVCRSSVPSPIKSEVVSPGVHGASVSSTPTGSPLQIVRSPTLQTAIVPASGGAAAAFTPPPVLRPAKTKGCKPKGRGSKNSGAGTTDGDRVSVQIDLRRVSQVPQGSRPHGLLPRL